MLVGARSFQAVKPHIPLIKFRKGGKQSLQVAEKLNVIAPAASRNLKGTGIEDTELPAKYSRKPVSQLEIEFIERGGPE